MRSLVLVRVAWQSILKNTMRTLLTMLGIIIGVGAVIVMVAVGLGAKERINQQIQNLGTNMIVLTAGSSKQGGVSQGAQSFSRLTVDNAEALRREGTLLMAISPVIFTGGHIQGGVGNWRTLDISDVPDFTPLNHTWSLAIEQQWYVVWPFIVIGLLSLRRGSLKLLLGATVVLALLSALLMAWLYNPGSGAVRIYYGTDTRAQVLLVGGALAVLFAQYGAIRSGRGRFALQVGKERSPEFWSIGAQESRIVQ